jgi:glutathione S-transferase
MSEANPGHEGSTGPVIRLYTQKLNPYSEKVAASLALKGLPFERIVSDNPEDIQRWSPIARTLPVLEIDGKRKADSLKIVAWLDQRFPEPPLFSRDPRIAEAQRRLADWSDNSFAWYWNRWRAARYPRPGDDLPLDASLMARIRGKIGRSLGHAPRSRADARELEIIQELQDRMNDLVGFLRDRPFFHSDEPSIADLSVYAMLLVLREGSIPHCADAIAERPTLAAFLDRMAGRIKSLEATREEPTCTI